MLKLKEKIKGKRIILKIHHPSFSLAKIIFETVVDNRKHLRPWFIWEKSTRTIEDSFKYLIETESLFNVGSKIDYGIYLNKKYIGNIGIFNINEKNKSAEIGYWLSSKFIKKGYTTEAVRLLEKESFHVGINRLQISCDERNVASAAVAKKCNYLFEGRFREDKYSEHFRNLRNTLLFSKLKAEYNLKK